MKPPVLYGGFRYVEVNGTKLTPVNLCYPVEDYVNFCDGYLTLSKDRKTSGLVIKYRFKDLCKKSFYNSTFYTVVVLRSPHLYDNINEEVCVTLVGFN